ncbi:hypothetical protein [Chitinimonas sp.]|uniref:hypothetical protein n=1 Tax=Chitinimonas sp. TaxID=1934313 RepID=UPI002F953B15
MSTHPLPQTRIYCTLRWGGLAQPPYVLANPGPLKALRQRVILLMPGYNVSDAKAHRELRHFEDHLRRVASQLSPHVGWLLWPGDWSVPLLRGAAYPFKLARTAAIGEAVAAFVAENFRGVDARTIEVVLVAHSLGCKVALEAAEGLRQALPWMNPSQLKLFLMGAAVASEEVASGGRLYQAARYSDARGVLHSSSDWILQTAFRAGQAVTPRQPWRSAAVGVRGEPAGTWTYSEPMAGYGHGAYWNSRACAEHFARFMGQPVSTPLASRPAAMRPMLPARLGLARQLALRRLGRR